VQFDFDLDFHKETRENGHAEKADCSLDSAGFLAAREALVGNDNLHPIEIIEGVH